MTVILDPGNQAESYNATVRQWRQSSGLWKTDYGTSQTNLANMTAAYNAKVTELATMTTNYNNAIASRDYWQHTVAHNDPAVWDNRYNAGYSAGNTAGYNSGYAAGDAALRNTMNNPHPGSNYVETNFTTSWPLDGTTGTYSLSLPKTGHWVVGIAMDYSMGSTTGGMNGYHTFQMTGPINETIQKTHDSVGFGAAAGFGRIVHGDYGAGTVQTWRQISAWRDNGQVPSGKIWAHYVGDYRYGA